MLSPPPSPGDIYELEAPRLRKSTHRHRALFIRVDGEKATFLFMSSQFDAYEEGVDFPIRTEDEDKAEFSLAGLSKSSYVIDDPHFDVPLTEFSGVFKGKVTGSLKKRIESWWGEAF
jgi:hypothetical protein